MGRREQELVDQHREWREKLDVMAEQPWQPAPPSPVGPRAERLAEARARRAERLAEPEKGYDPRPHFMDQYGVTLVYGPAPIMQKAWRSGEPVRVYGSRGQTYLVPLASISKPDNHDMVVGHPAGSLAGRNRMVRVNAKTTTQRREATKPKPNRGRYRGSRSR